MRLLVLVERPVSQRCSSIRCLVTRGWLGCQPGADSVSGRSVRFLLGVEGKRHREEHGECEDLPGETVRSLRVLFTTSTYLCHSWNLPLLESTTCTSLFIRYNDEISLEDAIHTALLTLKEGFEGQMTEKTIEIGVVIVPTQAELEAGKVEGTGRYKPTFRKLTEEEVRDYLAL